MGRVGPELITAVDKSGAGLRSQFSTVFAGKNSPPGGKNDIWYHFNEGYSNALKKPVKISALK